MKKERKFIWLCVGFALIVVLAPIIINELYKLNKGYLTLWGASEMLSYIATIISAVATVYVSWIAITQNKKANEINDRLLKLEEVNSVPSLSIIEGKTSFVEYSDKTVHFKVYLKNISNGIIDIQSVSDLNIHIIASDITDTLNFINQGLDFPTLLPGQEKQLDFSLDKRDDKFRLCESELIRKSKCKLHFSETFVIELGYKDASTVYKETVKLNGYGKFLISSNITIQEQKITRSDYKLEKQEEN